MHGGRGLRLVAPVGVEISSVAVDVLVPGPELRAPDPCTGGYMSSVCRHSPAPELFQTLSRINTVIGYEAVFAAAWFF